MKITAEGPSGIRSSFELLGCVVRVEFHLKNKYEACIFFDDLTEQLNAGQGLVVTLEGPKRVPHG